jgi:hypothetical protein
VSALGCVPLSAQLGPEQIRSLVEAEAVPSIELFREYLGLPNDAHFPEDIDRLVSWLDAALTDRGFTTERLATSGNDLLFAERHVTNPAATVLVYLQADGQPVDLSAWQQESPYWAELKQDDGTGTTSSPPRDHGRGTDHATFTSTPSVASRAGRAWPVPDRATGVERWRALGRLLPRDVRERIFEPAFGDLTYHWLTSDVGRRVRPSACAR